MKRLLPASSLGAIVCLICLISLIYLEFGAITPCGILKKRMKAAMVKDMETKDNLTLFFTATIGVSAVDNMIEALTPMQCLQRLRQR
jgi:hypothetical protein